MEQEPQSLPSVSEGDSTSVSTVAGQVDEALGAGDGESTSGTVGTGGSVVAVDNLREVTDGLTVPLLFILFAVAACVGALHGKGLNWWKW